MSLQPMTSLHFPSRVFLSKELRADQSPLQLPVSTIAINGSLNSDGRHFHYILALVSQGHLESGTSNRSKLPSATYLDMTPSYTDMQHWTRGNLLVSHTEHHQRTTQDGATADFTVAATIAESGERFTVGQICDLLINERRLHQYDFTEGGTGCRHWCATVLDTLANAGVIPDDSQGFVQWEKEQHAKHGNDKFPMPRIQGTFYSVG